VTPLKIFNNIDLILLFISAAETKRCLEYFSSHIEIMVCPQKLQIELFKLKENSQHHWKVYKDCVNTKIQAVKRRAGIALKTGTGLGKAF
jgi:hypothetical protein